LSADHVLAALTARQHVRPHGAVAEELAHVCNQLGICPVTAERAARWLEVPADEKLGRLRRTQVVQLARCLHRFSRHALAAAVRNVVSA
jgi:hypothetical protein